MKSIPIDQCPAGQWLDAAAAKAMGWKVYEAEYNGSTWIAGPLIDPPGIYAVLMGSYVLVTVGDKSRRWNPSEDIAAAWGLDDAGWLWHFQEHQDGLFVSVERDDITSFHCFVCWDGAKTDAQIIQQAYALARTQLFIKAHGITEVKIPDD